MKQIFFFLLDHPKKRQAFAFHAESTKHITNLPHNHKVVFDKIHLNEGGAYDPKSGIFTCKEPGIYVFDWTILTDPGKHFHTELMVDGVLHGRLHLHASSKHRSGSSMAVVKLKPGSRVWVEPHGSSVGQEAQNAWCFFSGFKIWGLNLYRHAIIKEYIPYVSVCLSFEAYMKCYIDI